MGADRTGARCCRTLPDVRQERRSGMMSVLFTDLVGSTDLMARLGEVAFDDLRRAHFATLRKALADTGGEEVKSTGDGLMAVFGSAVDAVRCAVAMQRGVQRQARTGARPLAIRVGLSLGEVTLEEDDVFGTPVVEAARLVTMARGGQILATAVVLSIAAGLRWPCRVSRLPSVMVISRFSRVVPGSSASR